MSALRTLAALLLLTPVLSAADLTTLAGKKVSGEIVSIDDQVIVIRSGGEEVRTPLKDVLEVTLPDPKLEPFKDRQFDVELIDGSLLHCSAFALKGKSVELVMLPDIKLSLPMKSVASIVADIQEPKIQKEWQTVLANRPRRDTFYLIKEGRLDGLDGTFGDADAEGKTIQFEASSGASRNLPIARLAALYLNNRLEGAIAPAVCRVGDGHRNQLVATKVVLAETGLSVTTVAGVTVAYPSLTTVAKLDYSREKVVYLSDLKPEVKLGMIDEQIALMGAWFADRNGWQNQPIALEGQIFAKGLMVRPHVTLTYDLGADYRELKTILGTDAGSQKVRVTFQADGREVFATELSAQDKAKPVALDVKGVRQLRIAVTPLESIHEFARMVALADAKVSK